MKKNKLSKKQIIIVNAIGILIIIAFFIGMSFAFFQLVQIGDNNIIQVADGINLELINEDAVSIDDTMPMTDDYAISNQDSYKFSLSNTGTQAYEYTISMKHEVVELPVSVIRYAVKAESDEKWSIGSLENFAYTNVINKNSEENFELKLWVDKSTTNDYQAKKYTGHIEVTAEVTEYIPINEITVDLTSGMVPIKWNGTTWVKADSTNAKGDWYDYNNYKWANMALVNDESLYTIEVNEEIPMEKILAMYVWIPRYRYKLFNTNNEGVEEQEIEVIFEDVSTPKSTGSTNGTYLTHPAFTFGTDELNGIWVGKFETSANQDSDCYISPSEANCNEKIDLITPRIKPNVDSLRFTNLLGAYTVSQKFKNYGLTQTNIDSHMVKNMEWGAVAYLSHSKYGKYGNSSYEGNNKEIYINNYRLNDDASKTLTGCSAGTPGSGAGSIDNVLTTCSYTYEKELTGTGASTTGTIYGIYDMAGGNWDFVMANMLDENEEFYPSGSGISSLSDIYYDSYSYSADATNGYMDFTRGRLGDATKEIIKTLNNGNGCWGDDYSHFMHTQRSWLVRGGYTGSGQTAGIFAFGGIYGQVGNYYASRSVLVNTN